MIFCNLGAKVHIIYHTTNVMTLINVFLMLIIVIMAHVSIYFITFAHRNAHIDITFAGIGICIRRVVTLCHNLPNRRN